MIILPPHRLPFGVAAAGLEVAAYRVGWYGECEQRGELLMVV